MARTAICEGCRRTFRAKRDTAKFCSSTCRSRAFRAKERQKTHGWDDLPAMELEKYKAMSNIPRPMKQLVTSILFEHGVTACVTVIRQLWLVYQTEELNAKVDREMMKTGSVI